MYWLLGLFIFLMIAALVASFIIDANDEPMDDLS